MWFCSDPTSMSYLDSADAFPPGAFPFHSCAIIHTYKADIRVKGTTYDDKKNDIYAG